MVRIPAGRLPGPFNNVVTVCDTFKKKTSNNEFIRHFLVVYFLPLSHHVVACDFLSRVRTDLSCSCSHIIS